jgi:cGMP-dependent protein kinase
MLYEFMCGAIPYGDDSDDPYEIYKSIMRTKVQFPEFFIKKTNFKAKEMIEQLLNKRPEARLGASFASLKSHKWFESFDWVHRPVKQRKS